MTHDRSAGEAVEKVCRSGSKAANSIVESSETKKVAMLAIQNTGQGEVVSGGGGVTAGQASEVVAVLSAEKSVGFMFYMMIVIFGGAQKVDIDMGGKIRRRKRADGSGSGLREFVQARHGRQYRPACGQVEGRRPWWR